MQIPPPLLPYYKAKQSNTFQELLNQGAGGGAPFLKKIIIKPDRSAVGFVGVSINEMKKPVF